MPILLQLKPTNLVPNSIYPLVYHRSAFPTGTSPEIISAHFAKHSWVEQWRSGMYHQSHYHSTTHEALGVFKGRAQLQFGVSDNDGEDNRATRVVIEVSEGDVIVIPSGVAHRCLKEEGGFEMIGAYPAGSQQWDMNYGGEAVKVDTSVPVKDPVYGEDSEGLTGIWRSAGVSQ